MDLARLLTDYGYWAVLAGTLLEGESILLLAGVAAQRGLMSLPLVVGIAFIGGFVGDQVLFWLGRRWGRTVLHRIPAIERGTARVLALLRRHDAALIVGIRFMYGLRLVGPVAIGASGVSPWRFLRFNAIGAALWAPAIAGLGYLFGGALGPALESVAEFPMVAAGVAVALALLLVAMRRRRRRQHGRGPTQSVDTP